MPDPRHPLSDEALAAAYRATRIPAGDHLSEAEWERLSCEELHGADRDRALAHIASCGECTAIHRGLLDLREQATNLEAGRTTSTRVAGRWLKAAGVAAAAALIAAVLINQPGRPSVSPDTVTRSGQTRESIAIVSPSPGSVLSGRRFEWRPVAGATSYELRVHIEDGTRVFATALGGTVGDLPAGVTLDKGAYFWQVVALKDEATVASSAMIPFRVN